MASILKEKISLSGVEYNRYMGMNERLADYIMTENENENMAIRAVMAYKKNTPREHWVALHDNDIIDLNRRRELD